MGRTSKLLAATGAIALMFASSGQALAATAAGTSVTNTVYVDYQVNGIAQTQQQASNTFVVDRAIDLTVAEVGTTTTQVTPGQLTAVTTFDVTNLSNATIDALLSTAQLSGGTAVHGGADTFDGSNIKIWVDNGDGVFNSTTDTQVAYIDQLAANSTTRVFVTVDIPLNAVTGDVAGVTLTATAGEGTTSGSAGAAITQTTGANTANAVDTVFADAAGATDALHDGAFSARDDYTVLAAAITVVKESLVLSDPVNGTTNPKAIPGATVQYCIKVSNAAGSATATNIAVSDPVPADVTYVASTAKVDGTVDGSGACVAGSTNGAFDSGTTTVSGTIPSVAAGETRTLVFNATID